VDIIGSRRDLLKILRRTRLLVSLPDNDFGLTSWDGPNEPLSQIDLAVEALGMGGDLGDPCHSILIMFAPTGDLGELAIKPCLRPRRSPISRIIVTGGPIGEQFFHVPDPFGIAGRALKFL
jgi:hypothetical protein